MVRRDTCHCSSAAVANVPDVASDSASGPGSVVVWSSVECSDPDSWRRVIGLPLSVGGAPVWGLAATDGPGGPVPLGPGAGGELVGPGAPWVWGLGTSTFPAAGLRPSTWTGESLPRAA